PLGRFCWGRSGDLNPTKRRGSLEILYVFAPARRRIPLDQKQAMRMGMKPAADVTLSPSLVQALLEDQHADLAHLAPVKVAEGWDNTLFRLGDELAVQGVGG